VDLSKTNPNGGSIPLGHPFGATGGRMILQAIYGLKQKKKNLALISICAAGGLGSVLVIENI
jgi:acetyl-CoA acyltransferase